MNHKMELKQEKSSAKKIREKKEPKLKLDMSYAASDTVEIIKLDDGRH